MAPSLEVIHNISPTITDLDASHSICVLGASPSCLWEALTNEGRERSPELRAEISVFAGAPGPCFGFVPGASLVPAKSEIHADDRPPL